MIRDIIENLKTNGYYFEDEVKSLTNNLCGQNIPIINFESLKTKFYQTCTGKQLTNMKGLILSERNNTIYFINPVDYYSASTRCNDESFIENSFGETAIKIHDSVFVFISMLGLNSISSELFSFLNSGKVKIKTILLTNMDSTTLDIFKRGYDYIICREFLSRNVGKIIHLYNCEEFEELYNREIA